MTESLREIRCDRGESEGVPFPDNADLITDILFP